MLFNWQVKDVCVVFEWWHIHTPVDLLLSCIAVFCIAAGYEYLRVWSGSLDDQWSQVEKKKLSDQRALVGHGEEEIETTDGAGSSFLRKDIIITRYNIMWHNLKNDDFLFNFFLIKAIDVLANKKF
jgi:copper transporter 1